MHVRLQIQFLYAVPEVCMNHAYVTSVKLEVYTTIFNIIYNTLPRSFTVRDPLGRGSNIGIVLYQKSYFVSKANQELTQKHLGKDCYPTGGMTVVWDDDPAEACFWHGSSFDFTYMLIIAIALLMTSLTGLSLFYLLPCQVEDCKDHSNVGMIYAYLRCGTGRWFW